MIHQCSSSLRLSALHKRSHASLSLNSLGFATTVLFEQQQQQVHQVRSSRTAAHHVACVSRVVTGLSRPRRNWSQVAQKARLPPASSPLLSPPTTSSSSSTNIMADQWIPAQARGFGHSHSHAHGHGHGHGHSHDTTYLTSSNKDDPGVRITRIGLYVNLGMAIAKAAGGYAFNSRA